MSTTSSNPILFTLGSHPLHQSLCQQLPATSGQYSYRQFPDGESYLRIDTPVQDLPCIVLVDLSYPDEKYLHLSFLIATLRELGAVSVGLVAPYLSYMRQDKRFAEGEAVTSRIFAKQVSQQVDWLVTVDPHLHRYHSLGEIYSIPNQVVHAAPLLAQWLVTQPNTLLVGPDAESKQWVSQVAETSKHPYVIGEKQRLGDRNVIVSLPDLTAYKACTAVIIDDVIASGQTLLKCVDALHAQGINQIFCAAIHGIFADDADKVLMDKGVGKLITTNSIPHSSNVMDLTGLLLDSIRRMILAL